MNEDKFSGKAELYAKYRPSYPDVMINWLEEHTNARSVADIGAGTGILPNVCLKSLGKSLQLSLMMICYLN